MIFSTANNSYLGVPSLQIRYIFDYKKHFVELSLLIISFQKRRNTNKFIIKMKRWVGLLSIYEILSYATIQHKHKCNVTTTSFLFNT